MTTDSIDTPRQDAGGPAEAAVKAAVLWAAALRMAGDVAARSPSAAPRAPGERASQDFAPAWDALLGRWLGEADGPASAAEGLVATFDYELDGGVLTHRAQASAPPGVTPYEVLMTFFPRPGGREADAVRFDNSGQALDLAGAWSADGRNLEMSSQPQADEPCWRLTWHFVDHDIVDTRLETAAAGTDAFLLHERGTLRRALG